MANTYTYLREDVIAHALRVAGIVPQGGVATLEQEEEAADKLNLILLDIANVGIQPLMSIGNTRTLTAPDLPFSSLALGENVVSIEAVWVIYQGGTPTPLAPADMIHKNDWKVVDGVPSQFYFDQKTQTLYLNYSVNSTDYVFMYISQEYINDVFTDGAAIPLPKRWYLAIVYMLAAFLADDYQLPLQERTYLMQRGQALFERARGSLANKHREHMRVTADYGLY